jgi:DNA-binding NarL/FixJ family response regulator
MRVVLADDAAVIRQGIARLLSDERFEIVAEVGDAVALLQAVDANRPDAVVLDIRMPPSFTDEGLVAADRIRASHPEVGVLLLSQHVDVAYATRLLRDRVERVGYLLKDRVTDVSTLTSALRRVHEGETVVDSGLVRELLDAPRADDPLEPLTAREREVLALIAEGRTDRGIAAELVVSPKTVEAHVRSIFSKLDLPTAPTENRRVHAVLAFLQR